jgi:hypothetical protein
MRPEWRWVAAFGAALALGALCAPQYARLAAPCYQGIAMFLAQDRPWDIESVEVAEPAGGAGAVLRMQGVVRASPGSLRPVARLVGKVQVGAVVEAPVIFWTLVLLWPATGLRQRLARCCLALPVFVALEAATTVCQLLNPLAYASAVIDGERDPVTAWEYWSRFIEDGGRIVLAVGAAVLTVSISSRWYRTTSPIYPDTHDSRLATNRYRIHRRFGG